jgi:hypothetical protein
MSAITLYIGLDVHKDSITVAIAEPGTKSEIRLFGAINNSTQAIERLLAVFGGRSIRSELRRKTPFVC